MSVLWEESVGSTHYSVRTAGATIRLYSNGVFHSQWNPNSPFAGGVWDCLSLPALYLESAQPCRVLLLGVGGGAVIRQLQCLLPNWPTARNSGAARRAGKRFDKDPGHGAADCIAVELDAMHLQIARRWFEVPDGRMSLIHDDAIEWLQAYRGEPFDLVIDDLFGHSDGEPVRAQTFNPDWVGHLRRVTRRNGVLVANFVSTREMKTALPVLAKGGFRDGFLLRQRGYENAIVAVSAIALSARSWSDNLQATDLSSAMKRKARQVIRRPLDLPVP